MSGNEDEGYAVRVRRALRGQLAPKAQDGGVRILFRCQTCGHAWLRDGRRTAPRPSAEELARLVVELRADPDTLPGATCPICDATLAGMELSFDGYHDRTGTLRGIGVSYEGVEPPGAHLLFSAFNLDWFAREGATADSGVIVDFARTRRFLTWLSTMPAPRGGFTPLGGLAAELMARDNPPGHGASGTEGWIWRGGVWRAHVSALEGECAISLGQAMPPDEPYRLEASIVLIRLVAQVALQGHIAGEPD